MKILSLFVLLLCFIIKLSAEVSPVMPHWIDFERVFSNTQKVSQETILPIVIDNVSYRVKYAPSSKSGRIERVELLPKTSSKVLAAACFSWQKREGKDVLTSFWLEDEKAQVTIKDTLYYTAKGKLQKTITSFGSGEIEKKKCRYNAAGKPVCEKTFLKNGGKTVRRWAYDDAGNFYKKKKDIFLKDAKKPQKRIELLRLAQNIFRREEIAFCNGKESSRSVVEWEQDKERRLVWFATIGAKGTKRITSYTYNQAGQPASKVRPDGVVLYYQYNNNGRLSHLFSSDGTVDYFVYYDDQGRIVEVKNKDIHLKRSFSNTGKILSEEVNGRVIAFEYNERDQKIRTHLPDGSKIEYIYLQEVVSAIRRIDPKGFLLYEHSVQLKDSHAFDPNSKSFEVELKDPFGTYTLAIEYDDFGQIQKETGEFNHQYYFDAVGRLLEKDGCKTILSEFGELAFSGQKQFQYDANGNLIAKLTEKGAAIHFSYDALDRLIKISQGNTVIDKCAYDIFNRRVKSGDTYYLWEGGEEVGAVTNKQVVELKIYANGNIELIELQGVPYKVDSDFRGSVTTLKEKETDNVAAVYRYSAFGEEKCIGNHTVKSPWKYAGKRTFERANIVYYGMRYYDVDAGRWLTQDPLHFIDGSNTVAFILNDPVRNIDPTGLYTVPLSFSGITASVKNGMKDMYNKTIQTITFARHELEWFYDFRSHFEDIAFKFMSKKLWTLFGYNPDHDAIKKVGEANASDKVRVTLINGILNPFSHAQDNAKLISSLHGNTAIHYLYAATSGFTADILRAIFAKFGFATAPARLLADTWRKFIAEMGGVGSGGHIIHYAHSLGGADTYRALQLLTDDERKMIRVVTFGSLWLIDEHMAKNVHNYVSNTDLIPTLFAPVQHIKGRIGFVNNITFLKSESFIHHGLNKEGYLHTLEELGKKFQEDFLATTALPKGMKNKSVLSMMPKSFIAKNATLPNEKESEIAEKIRTAIRKRDFLYAGKLIGKNISKVLTYNDMQKIAQEENSEPLLQAIKTCRKIINLKQKLGLKRGELLQLALFIETDLAKEIDSKNYYLRESETGLPRIVEHDPKRKHNFIHLGTHGIPMIGRGFHKTVTKSILYNHDNPEIVANCRTSLEDKREMKVIEELQGVPGIVEGRSFIVHTKHSANENQLEIILKLYNASSLRSIYYKKTQQFTLQEKMGMALDLLTGLAAMHEKNLVHRDLHTGNYLVDIKPKEDGKREVKAVITDFGRTMPKKECPGEAVQAFRWYIAPEGILPHKLHSNDYFATDVYALGCVFHEIYYEKDPKWFTDRIFKHARGSEYERKQVQKKLYELAEKTTLKRFEKLKAKALVSQLTTEEKFETLILKMVHPDPKERGKASELRDEMAAIYAAIC